MVVLITWAQWRALGSMRDTHDAQARQLAAMRVDAARILELRQAPKAAVSRTRANEELLAQIERALAAAGIERHRWQDSIPQPPIRLTKSDYRRLTTRVYLQGITLRQLAAFGHHLRQIDPTLSVSALSLSNRQLESADFDVDVGVSYLVFAPMERRFALP